MFRAIGSGRVGIVTGDKLTGVSAFWIVRTTQEGAELAEFEANTASFAERAATRAGAAIGAFREDVIFQNLLDLGQNRGTL